MRTLQLTYQARETPEAPGDEMLSRDEIDAAIPLREPKGYTVGDVPPLGLAVRWIAEIGGLTNHCKRRAAGQARGRSRIGSNRRRGHGAGGAAQAEVQAESEEMRVTMSAEWGQGLDRQGTMNRGNDTRPPVDPPRPASARTTRTPSQSPLLRSARL